MIGSQSSLRGCLELSFGSRWYRKYEPRQGGKYRAFAKRGELLAGEKKGLFWLQQLTEKAFQ